LSRIASVSSACLHLRYFKVVAFPQHRTPSDRPARLIRIAPRRHPLSCSRRPQPLFCRIRFGNRIAG
jgi:hypothetical protein